MYIVYELRSMKDELSSAYKLWAKLFEVWAKLDKAWAVSNLLTDNFKWCNFYNFLTVT